MAVFLLAHNIMKKIYLLAFSISALAILSSVHLVRAQQNSSTKTAKSQTVIYFNPTVYPNIEEIRQPTYDAFFTAVSDRVEKNRNYKMLRVESGIPYDEVDSNAVQQFCENNGADYAVVPKVKFFKVGIGQYVFSNQVVVSMKLYDATGKLVAETDYDTYKKKARMLGTAENSIKIGTEGAMKTMGVNLKKSKVTGISFSDK